MNKEVSLGYLYTALADELLAAYQYWTAKNCSRGEGKFDADPEFNEHEKDELEHVELIMGRIKELGGGPIPDPADWQKLSNPWTAIDMRDVRGLLEITMESEQSAINFYEDAIKSLKDVDPVTHRIFRKILQDETQHLYDLKELFCSLEGCDFEDFDPGLGITASDEF